MPFTRERKTQTGPHSTRPAVETLPAVSHPALGAAGESTAAGLPQTTQAWLMALGANKKRQKRNEERGEGISGL